MAEGEFIAVERTLFTGANTKKYAGLIGPTELSLAENVDLSLPGQMRGALGWNMIADDVGTKKILAMKRYKKSGGSDLLMMMEDTNLRSWAGTGNWSAAIDSGFTTNLDTLFLVGNDLLLISNGTDNVHSYNQTTVADLNDTNASPPKALCGCYTLGRFFMANTSTYPDYIWFSNQLSTTFDRTTNVFKISAGSGSAIMGVVDVGNGELCIIKEDEIHTLYISDTDPANWFDVKQQIDDGAASKKAIVKVGSDVFFLSRKKRGISSIGKNEYEATTGTTVAISDPLYKDYMDSINWAYASTACGVLFDNKLIFALPIGTATTPDHWFIYWLNEDNSINGWSVIKSPATYCFEKYIVSGAEYLYYGDSGDGKVYQAFTTNLANGSAITKTVKFRSEDFADSGAQNNEKIGQYVELSFLSGTDTGAVSCLIETDDSNSFDVLGSASIPTTGVALPNVLPCTIVPSGKTVFRYELNNLNAFRRCRLKIEQTESNKNFNFLGYMIVAQKQPIIP